LPVLLVGAHMLGAALFWIAALAALRSLRTRPPLHPDDPFRTAPPAPAESPGHPIPASR
jgi:cytochrome c oxidase assembly protein subunit 15